MKINNLFRTRTEPNTNFWGVPEFRLYRTGDGGGGGGGGVSEKGSFPFVPLLVGAVHIICTTRRTCNIFS